MVAATEMEGRRLNLEMSSDKKGTGTRAWEGDQLRLQQWVPWEPEVVEEEVGE